VIWSTVFIALFSLTASNWASDFNYAHQGNGVYTLVSSSSSFQKFVCLLGDGSSFEEKFDISVSIHHSSGVFQIFARSDLSVHIRIDLHICLTLQN
jgi:hypothetical protein